MITVPSCKLQFTSLRELIHTYYLSFQKLIMNRSIVSCGRLIANYNLRKTDLVGASINQIKNYHFSSSRQELLRFTPASISLDGNRRSLFSTKETEPDKEAKKEDEAGQEASEAEKALQEQVTALEEKNADLLDKYRRSLADFENLRNRMNKQVADAKIFGIQGFCKVRKYKVMPSKHVISGFQSLTSLISPIAPHLV